MPLIPDALRCTAGPSIDRVDPERVRAYAAATNDAHPAYAAPDAVPPVFAVIPSWDLVMGLGQQVIPPSHHLMIVHGWQDMHFHRPLEVGEEVTSTARVRAVRADRLGTQLVLQATTSDAEGQPVVGIYTTTVVRGLTGDVDAGPDRPQNEVDRTGRGERLLEDVLPVDPDQTYRYAAASGDVMPIHTDAELARRVGLPGIICHGLCTMAMCGQVVLRAAGDASPQRLRRLAVRFVRPVLPGSQLHVSVMGGASGGDGGEDGGRRLVFEARSRGRVVVKDGIAVIGP